MKAMNLCCRAFCSLTLLPAFILGNEPSMAQNSEAPAKTGQAKVKQTETAIVHPSKVTLGTYWGESRPLRDIPPATPEELAKLKKTFRQEFFNPTLKYRSYPNAAAALLKGEDPVIQKQMGEISFDQSEQVNFDGQTSEWPPDENGAAGPNHYMQTVNVTYAIYDKSGTIKAGPTNINQIFGNVPGASRNDGDPIVIFDKQADRYLVAEFSIPDTGTLHWILVAISKTNDPLGSWHQYSFPADKMPDYIKFGVWRDGYYVGVNNTNGLNDIFVMEREKMLVGDKTARMLPFKNPYRPGPGGFMVVPPANNDGPFAPEGTPGQFIAINDAGWGGSCQLWIYELAVNWTTPSASTFQRTQQIDVATFSSNFGNDWSNIRQKGSTQKVDAVPTIIMNMPQYRNFGSYQTLVCCHTVNVDGKGRAGIRWYELRKTNADWSIRQQSTYSPDTTSRWMGSVLLNGENKIGLGYSVSSLGEYPGIRYCGQTSTAYLAGNSTLDIAETTIWSGAYSQEGTNRWGDYSSLALDPVDDKTFWYTNQYIKSDNTTRGTRTASFVFNSPVGVNSLEGSDKPWFRVFPNPSGGIFTIVPQNAAVTSLYVQVFDIAGRLILGKQFGPQNEYSIDLSQASRGVYSLRMQNWKSVQTIKLIKN
ncbi:MAG: T9SS type A sorting domain-containing protein [Bacteroidales bacterium]